MGAYSEKGQKVGTWPFMQLHVSSLIEYPSGIEVVTLWELRTLSLDPCSCPCYVTHRCAWSSLPIKEGLSHPVPRSGSP